MDYKSIAMKLWKDIFGDKLWAVDCFGTWIYRDDYGVQNKLRKRPNGDGKQHTYGWEIDHIKPKSSFKQENDADSFNNFEPMHYENNRNKSDKLQFEINGNQYQVVKCDICAQNGYEGYGILDVKKKKRVDWKAVTNSYYGK